MRVVCPEDCGNAPRKVILRDLTTALAQGDLDYFARHVRDDLVWEVVGENRNYGFDSISDAVSAFPPNPELLEIRAIITHGWICSIDGTIQGPDGTGLHFCDVYHFAGAAKTAKVKSIRSYRIVVQPSPFQ